MGGGTATAPMLAANRAFYRALSSGDLPAMDRLWSRERPVSCIHPGRPALSGRDAVMASWRSILTRPPAISAENPSVAAHGDIAVVLCVERAGTAVMTATNIFARSAEGWKMVHHHAGPVARPPSAPADKSRTMH